MIKAAIIKFGYNHVFSKVEKRREYFIITLRSKQVILLSEKEIEKYNRKNGIDFEKYKDPGKKENVPASWIHRSIMLRRYGQIH